MLLQRLGKRCSCTMVWYHYLHHKFFRIPVVDCEILPLTAWNSATSRVKNPCVLFAVTMWIHQGRVLIGSQSKHTACFVIRTRVGQPWSVDAPLATACRRPLHSKYRFSYSSASWAQNPITASAAHTIPCCAATFQSDSSRFARVVAHSAEHATTNCDQEKQNRYAFSRGGNSAGILFEN